MDAGKRARPYLAMDYFDGVPLDAYVRQHGPLATSDVKQIMRPIAEALRAAHAKGILHPDVKPANVLVRQEEEGWRVKLIDFGLALKQSTMENTVRSPAGQDRIVAGASIAGTLEYAAPEQMGKLPGVTLGPHSDVFGFGKTCYFAALGTPDPDDKQKATLPVGWRKLLSDCIAHPPHRLADFSAVLQRLVRLKDRRAKKQDVEDVPPDDEDESGPERTGPASHAWSSSIRTICPHCRKELMVRAEDARRSIRCPSCLGAFTLSVGARLRQGSTPARQPRAIGALQATCPRCDQRISEPRDGLGRPMKCPRCSAAFRFRAAPRSS